MSDEATDSKKEKRMKTGKRTFSISLDEGRAEWMDEEAIRQGLTRSEFLRRLIDDVREMRKGRD